MGGSEALVLLALLVPGVLVGVLLLRRSRERGQHAPHTDTHGAHNARAAKLAAEQAIIARSGGQGMNQGGFGGGMGS